MGDPGEAASVSPPCSKRRRKNAPRCIDCGQNAFPPTCICLECFAHRLHGVAAGTKVFFHFVSGERLWPGMWRQGLPGRLTFQDIQHEKWHRERDSVPVEYVLLPVMSSVSCMMSRWMATRMRSRFRLVCAAPRTIRLVCSEPRCWLKFDSE